MIAGVQRRLAAGNDGNSIPSIRKPSDAARKRVEERAARNRAGGGMPSSTAVRSKPIKAPVAPAPAPVADLLDFGDFDSPEATAAVTSSSVGVVANNPTQTAAPVPNAKNNELALDLFANMSVGDVNGGGTGQTSQQQPKKMTNDDILSMFSAPNKNQMQQNNMFAMGGGGGMSTGIGMHGSGNMMMNQQGGNMMMTQQAGNMGNYNNTVMNGGNNAMIMNNSMAMNAGGNNPYGNMMGGGNTSNQNPHGNAMGGMNNQMMVNNQMMIMMQQQQQQQFQSQMQHMNMQGGGIMMQGGNRFGQSSGNMSAQGQKQARGGSYDQFAEFGNFRR